ncbi:MAG: hypothetical protein LBD33_02545 [Puniceicoccales bacterium]|jgi:hypothetical protein|nr:hypothetical protein [Puniceicoccales bacterium]
MKVERSNNSNVSNFNKRLNVKNLKGKSIRQKVNALFFSTDDFESNCPVGESGMMCNRIDLSGAMAFVSAFIDASE